AAIAGFWTGASTIVLVQTGGCGGGVPRLPGTIYMQYPGPPIIVSNPQNTKARVGESALLSVVASGGITLYYQWYLGQSGDTNAPIAGATNATYITPPFTADVSYWVRAETPVGATNSATATIAVYPADSLLLELSVADGLEHFTIHAPPDRGYTLQ